MRPRIASLPFFLTPSSIDTRIMVLSCRLGFSVLGVHHFIQAMLHRKMDHEVSRTALDKELELIAPGSWIILVELIKAGVYQVNGDVLSCEYTKKLIEDHKEQRETWRQQKEAKKQQKIEINNPVRAEAKNNPTLVNDTKEAVDLSIKFVSTWEELGDCPYGIEDEFRRATGDLQQIYDTAVLWVGILKAEKWVKASKYRDPLIWLREETWKVNTREAIGRQLNITHRMPKIEIVETTKPILRASY